ncbi:MAG: SDR family NAD(P)-dependent oxidoreductase, partial [Burkholderia sp.]
MRAEPTASVGVDDAHESATQAPIAIIGIAGRYPQAPDLAAFWENLKAGRDAVTEIPAERWSLHHFYDEDPPRAAATGKSYSKWGGFLDGFADFDPLFFNIAPREALAMDPQERLFLQCAWHAMEDAGYTRATLGDAGRRRVGVFVGVTKTGFELYGPALRARGDALFPHTSFASIANRVSYCLDLSGPSMPIDTMCSSSLTAIHEACQHIRHGECEMAIAGGVNLYLHASTYVGLSSAYMLSRDGRCRSFGAGGNGFVPGEGVGAVLLKRLSDAVRDGDPIHAVIVGSAVNHGGKTNGYTVPNPDAQAALIRDCLRRAGLDARDLGYVEAHGTGTALGDPIELAGLTRAFRADTDATGFCRLGSVKSNIGHLEAAAGIAGLSKIVLQMRHGQLAPSLHAATPNPNLAFDGTPFMLQQSLTHWSRPMSDIHDEIRELPRRAGLSSFGAGGANAHLVIEEYRSDARDGAPSGDVPRTDAVIVLSAKQADRLREAAAQLLAFVTVAGDAASAPDLHEIAHTLQAGREAMDERLAFVASSLDALADRLRAWLAGEGRPLMCHGRVERGSAVLRTLVDDAAFGVTVDQWLDAGLFEKLLPLWVSGYAVDFSRLYRAGAPRRIALPGYPFAKQRYWVDIDSAAPGRDAPAQPVGPDRAGATTADASVADPASRCGETPRVIAMEVSVERATALGDVSGVAASGVAEPGMTTLRPVWVVRAERADAALPSADARVAIVGGNAAQRRAVREHCRAALDWDVADDATVETLLAQLRKRGAGGRLDHLIWFAPPPADARDDAPIAAQRLGVLRLFQLVKALHADGYGDAPFGLTAITARALAVHDGESHDPTHAAVHGFVGSLAGEFPRWRVAALDLDAPGAAPDAQAWRAPVDGSAALREGEWLTRKLVPLYLAGTAAEPYRRQGVYLVIGGAGGLGRAWTRAMIDAYDARVVWLGRSAPDDAPGYLRGDARDAQALDAARRAVLARHGRLDGVIVSTLGAYDRPVEQMSEALFREILSTKVDVAVRVAQCFRDTPLDFVAFLSSMAAFGRAGGMTAYASACAFGDAYARRLALDSAWPVKVVNWGYWNVGGGERIAPALKKLAEQRGVRPIDAGLGLPVLKALLAGALPQIAATRTTQPQWIEQYADDEWVAEAADRHPPAIDDIAAYRHPSAAPGENPLTRQLDDWIVRLLFAQLQALGLFGPTDAPAGAAQLRERAGILDKYDRWWRESLGVLAAHGYLALDGERVAPGARAGVEHARVLAEWRDAQPRFLAQPETRTLAVLVEDCLSQLHAVLRGAMRVTDILFPGGSMDKIAGLYRDNRVCDYFNDVVAGVIDIYIGARARHDPAARIRILEVGAGTGGTTSAVLPSLERWRDRIDAYAYTDLSRAFFHHAKRRYGDAYPYLHYQILDIEAPLAGQGVDPGSYDIVIGTNVLHATRNMRNTLRNAKAALRNNGILIMNEISTKTIFASVLFGLIDGWSLAEDGHWRIPGSPGLFPERWHTLLSQEGYGPVLFPARDQHALGQQIVVAASDGVIRQRGEAPPALAARSASALRPVGQLPAAADAPRDDAA